MTSMKINHKKKTWQKELSKRPDNPWDGFWRAETPVRVWCAFRFWVYCVWRRRPATPTSFHVSNGVRRSLMQMCRPGPPQRVYQPQIRKRISASVVIVNIWNHLILFYPIMFFFFSAATGDGRFSAENRIGQFGEKHETKQAKLNQQNGKIKYNKGRSGLERPVTNKFCRETTMKQRGGVGEGE